MKRNNIQKITFNVDVYALSVDLFNFFWKYCFFFTFGTSSWINPIEYLSDEQYYFEVYPVPDS